MRWLSNGIFKDCNNSNWHSMWDDFERASNFRIGRQATYASTIQLQKQLKIPTEFPSSRTMPARSPIAMRKGWATPTIKLPRTTVPKWYPERRLPSVASKPCVLQANETLKHQKGMFSLSYYPATQSWKSILEHMCALMLPGGKCHSLCQTCKNQHSDWQHVRIFSLI